MATVAAPPLNAVRLIFCVLPDDGTDRTLIRALRTEKGIEVADSIACRGVSVLREAKTQQAGQLPESNFVKLVQIITPEATAAALFEYVAATAQIGRPNGGKIILSQPIQATPYKLPEGLPVEAS